jgi:hypothetical protein
VRVREEILYHTLHLVSTGAARNQAPSKSYLRFFVLQSALEEVFATLLAPSASVEGFLHVR